MDSDFQYAIASCFHPEKALLTQLQENSFNKFIRDPRFADDSFDLGSLVLDTFAPW